MTGSDNKITLTIDGRETTVAKGTTVLEAAKMLGINIPTFCWHPKLKSVGACRICYVEIEKMPKLQVSCATEATAGMVVHTDSEKVRAGRKAVLEFILLNHPLDCPTCDKGGECDLQDNTFAHGIDDSRFDFDKSRFIRDRKATFDDYRIGPEIIRNQNRCILCFKCVRANKEIFGEYDIGAFERGNVTEIDAAPGQQVDSIYSGNLVEICPVGALTNTDWRYRIRVWNTTTVKSICRFCGDGCNLTLWKGRNQIHRTTSRRNDAIDEGWICDVGRYGYQIVAGEGRLATPLIKKGEKQVSATWDEAIELIARKFKAIKDKKGGVCIGGLVSPMLDAASLHAFSKFFRVVLRSNNIDFRTDYKSLPDKPGDLYSQMTALNFRIAEIEKSDLILIIGSNLIKEHPIVNLRVRKAVTQKGAALYTINPFATKSGDISTDELITRPGTIEALLNGLCLCLMEQKSAAVSKDAAPLKTMLEPNTLRKAAAICGISEERLANLARRLIEAKNVTIIAGDLIAGSSSRESISAAINNLALSAGIYERGQIGFLARYANSKGAKKLGLLPFIDSHLQDSLKNLWNCFPDNSGLTTDAMLAAACKEEIDSLFVVGCNPLVLYPDGAFAREAFEKLDFLVVADLFETATTEMADVVLPLASWAEYGGRFVNLEGTVQAFEAAIKPPGKALPAFEMLNLIARTLREPLFEEISELDREVSSLLENTDTRAPQMSFCEVRFAEEKINPEFPTPLFVIDDLHHFGHHTEKSGSLLAFTGEPYLEISPETAQKLNLSAGEMVRVESETGRLILPARISEHLHNDVVLVPRNFSTLPVNTLQMRRRRIDRVKLTRAEDA